MRWIEVESKRSADTMGCMHKVNGERQSESTAATRLWTTGPSLHTGLLEISVAANNMGEDWTEIPCVPRRHQNVITRQRVRSSLAVIRGLAVSALIIIACRNVEAPRQPGPCLGVIHAPPPIAAACRSRPEYGSLHDRVHMAFARRAVTLESNQNCFLPASPRLYPTGPHEYGLIFCRTFNARQTNVALKNQLDPP